MGDAGEADESPMRHAVSPHDAEWRQTADQRVGGASQTAAQHD